MHTLSEESRNFLKKNKKFECWSKELWELDSGCMQCFTLLNKVFIFVAQPSTECSLPTSLCLSLLRPSHCVQLLTAAIILTYKLASILLCVPCGCNEIYCNSHQIKHATVFAFTTIMYSKLMKRMRGNEPSFILSFETFQKWRKFCPFVFIYSRIYWGKKQSVCRSWTAQLCHWIYNIVITFRLIHIFLCALCSRWACAEDATTADMTVV